MDGWGCPVGVWAKFFWVRVFGVCLFLLIFVSGLDVCAFFLVCEYFGVIGRVCCVFIFFYLRLVCSIRRGSSEEIGLWMASDEFRYHSLGIVGGAVNSAAVQVENLDAA